MGKVTEDNVSEWSGYIEALYSGLAGLRGGKLSGGTASSLKSAFESCKASGWADDVGVESKEVFEKPLCFVLPIGIAKQRQPILRMLLAESFEVGKKNVERRDAAVIEQNHIFSELVEGGLISEIITFEGKGSGRYRTLGQGGYKRFAENLPLTILLATLDDNVVLVGIELHQLLDRRFEENRTGSRSIIDEGIVQRLPAPERQDEARSLLFASFSNGGYLRGFFRSEEDIQLAKLREQRFNLRSCRATIPSMNVEIDASLSNTIGSHQQASIELQHVLVAKREQDADLQIGNSSTDNWHGLCGLFCYSHILGRQSLSRKNQQSAFLKLFCDDIRICGLKVENGDAMTGCNALPRLALDDGMHVLERRKYALTE